MSDLDNHPMWYLPICAISVPACPCMHLPRCDQIVPYHLIHWLYCCKLLHGLQGLCPVHKYQQLGCVTDITTFIQSQGEIVKTCHFTLQLNLQIRYNVLNPFSSRFAEVVGPAPMFLFLAHINNAESTKNSLRNCPSNNGLLFLAILWGITKLVLLLHP